MLGRFCQDRGDKQEAEKWFVKSLRIVMDASDEEEETELDLDLLNLKGIKLIHRKKYWYQLMEWKSVDTNRYLECIVLVVKNGYLT